MPNPLQDTYSAIWTMLTANSTFASLVPAANRVRYDGVSGTPDTDVDSAAPADYPRVRVTLASASPSPEETSNGSRFQFAFAIQVKCGEAQHGVLLDVVWAIYRACMKWRTYLRDGKSFAGKPFISNFRPNGVKFLEGDNSLDKSDRQWVSVWEISADLWFQSSDIQEA
jgi:hypothetical protein